MEQTYAAFEALVAAATESLDTIATEDSDFLRGATASEVEQAVCEVLKSVCGGTPFRSGDVRLVSGARFPDIVVAGRFGVEVKSTAHDRWTSTGSSIVETTREPGVESILLLFAKLGGERPEFRCRPYGQVQKEIAVTHCPRYLIDMELAPGDSIFDRMGTDYDSFRTGGRTIASVREYYRDKALAEGRTEMPWWLGDANDDAATSVTVGFWRDLPAQTRQDYQARMFALFPEVLRSDFDNASLWLVTTKSVLNSHIRDTFTAGGMVRVLNGDTLAEPVPQIYKRLLSAAPLVRALLSDQTFLATEARVFNPSLLAADFPSTPFDAWLGQIADITA
ncbi:MAG: hypothetical protein K2O33_07235, partial [Muribaculaceae bacterium]|nr:hypothetical protein [Muribaculaceae bacterium]